MPQALIAFAAWAGTAIEGAIATVAPALITSVGVATAVETVAEAVVLLGSVAAVAEVSSLLTPKVGGTFGTQVQWKGDPQAGLPYAVGRTAVGGNIVFRYSAGTKSSYMNTVTVYTCAGPIDSYESFLVNDTAVTFGTDSGEGASGFYQNKMWRLTQLGASPESSYLHPTATGTKDTPADHSGLPTEWSSTHKLSGLAADLWINDFDTGRYAGGIPQRMTVAKWVKAYDPRLDSTYPGGSGSQRSNNEATWTWTANPYLHALTWLLGRTQNGKRVIGVGLPISAIDVPAFVNGANVADANSWTCGGQVYSTDDKWEVLKAFLQAGSGLPMRLGAKVSCLVNQPRTSIATLLAADVVGDVAVAGGTTRRDRINTIWPSYREETQSWSMVTLDAPISVSSYVTADGNQVRSRAVQYPLVQNATQVAQLARYDIENLRELTPIQFPCKPIWMGLGPGDCITANEPEWGLNGQKLIIVKRTRDPSTMQITLVCRTETDAKHAFALGQTGTAPSTPQLTSFDPSTFPAPGAGIYTVAGSTLTASGTSSSTAAVTITATTNAPDTPYAVSLLYRYRVHGTTAWAYGSAPIGVDHIDVTSVVPGVGYDVQVAYRSVRGTESPYTDLTAGGAVTAGSTSVPGRVFINARPASPLEGDVNVVEDGNGRVTGLETYHSGSWIQGSTNNKVTVSATAPATPTVNDIWVELDGNGRPTGIAYWSGTVWIGAATSNKVTTSASAPSTPTAGDVWVQLDANARIFAWATWSGTAWVQSGTNNNVTRSTTAPTTPTVNDVWIQLSGTTPIAVNIWNGSAWVTAGDLTSANTAAAITGQGPWATTTVPITSVTQPNQNLLFNATGQLNDLTGWTNDASAHFAPAFDSQKGWGFAWNFGSAATFTGMHFFSDPVGSAVGAGVTFTVQAICDFKNRTSGTIDLTVVCYDASDSFLGNATGTVLGLTGGYLSGTFTTLASTDHVRVFFTMDNLVTSSSSSQAFIYKVMLEKGSQTSPWNDAATNVSAALDPRSTLRFRATGSIPPTVPGQAFTYTSTTSSVTISWATMTIYRADGTTVTISSGSQAITGLSSSTTYKVYPYATDTGGTGPLTMSFATGGTGVGTPADAYAAAGDAAAAAQMYAQGHIPLNGFSVATTSSGSGSGGGGGIGCLHPDQLVGNRRAADLQEGDVLKSPEGHTRVAHVGRKACSEWYAVHVDGAAEAAVVVTAEHRFLLAAGGEVKAKALSLGLLLATSADHAEVTALRLVKEPADLVCVELDAPHLYFVGGRELLCHNVKP